MRRYQHSALGYTFLLSALTIQWSILNVEFWHQVWDTVASGVDKFGKVVGTSDGVVFEVDVQSSAGDADRIHHPTPD